MTRFSPLIVLLISCEHGQTPPPGCGNGVLDFGEQCDDGNQEIDDGCTPACVTENECGNGLIDAFEQCDDGDTFSGDGCDSFCQLEPDIFPNAFMFVDWQFQDLATGNATTCPTGFDTVEITYVGELAQMTIVDLRDCEVGSTTSQELPKDLYTVSLKIQDVTPPIATYATSLPQQIDLRLTDGTYSTVIFNDAGFFGLSWQLRGATTNNVLSCLQAGVETIEITSTGTGAPEVDAILCDAGSAFSTALLPGAYTVAIEANDGAGNAVATATPLTGRTIEAPNVVTDLGTIEISIPGK